MLDHPVQIREESRHSLYKCKSYRADVLITEF